MRRAGSVASCYSIALALQPSRRTSTQHRRTCAGACEYEADHVGMLLASAACYDPRRAARLWEDLEKSGMGGGGKHDAYLSSHPSHANRGIMLNSLVSEGIMLRAAGMCPTDMSGPFVSS